VRTAIGKKLPLEYEFMGEHPTPHSGPTGHRSRCRPSLRLRCCHLPT
jgi:hypothetical protein